MISKLSAKYQFCAIRTADTRDGQLTTPGVYTWVVRELSIVCPSFIPAQDGEPRYQIYVGRRPLMLARCTDAARSWRFGCHCVSVKFGGRNISIATLLSPRLFQPSCTRNFRVCVYMNSNVITLWSNQCMPHSHAILYWNNNKTRPSLVPSRETINTGPTYAPSKHTKCAKTQHLTEKSNKSPTQ